MTDRTAIAIAARPRLLAYAISLCRDYDQAEDLVQDAYVRILPKLGTIEPASAIPAVLIRTVRNRWIDIQRHERLLRIYPLPDRWLGIKPDERDEAGVVPAALVIDSPETVVLDVLDLRRVHDVLRLLRPRQQAILIAVYWLDEPVGTTNARKMAVFHARRAFRKRWEAAA